MYFDEAIEKAANFYVSQQYPEADKKAREALRRQAEQEIEKRLENPIDVSAETKLRQINQLLIQNKMPRIYQKHQGDEESVKSLANLLTSVGIAIGSPQKLSEEQKDMIEKVLKSGSFRYEFKNSIPAEQKLERINRFFQKNGLAKIEPYSAKFELYRNKPYRESFLEQKTGELEKIFVENKVFENTVLTKKQKEAVVSAIASYFGKRDGFKPLDSTPVSVMEQYLPYMVKPIPQHEADADIQKGFHLLGRRFPTIDDLPEVKTQVKYLKEKGCSAEEVYYALQMQQRYEAQNPDIPITKMKEIAKAFPKNDFIAEMIQKKQPSEAEQKEAELQRQKKEELRKEQKMQKLQRKKLEILYSENISAMHDKEMAVEEKDEEMYWKFLEEVIGKGEKKISELPYPNNLLAKIGVYTEQHLSRAFEQHLIGMLKKTASNPERDLGIVQQYYRDNKTMSQIAEENSVSTARIREIIRRTTERGNIRRGNPYEKLLFKDYMHELKYQEPDYPNNILEKIGFGKVEGKLSEGFQSMLEDVMENATNAQSGNDFQMMMSFFKEGNSYEETDTNEAVNRMKQAIPVQEVAELLTEELKNNPEAAFSKDSSLKILLHMKEPAFEMIYDVLTASRMQTFGDVIQAGMEQVQKQLSEVSFTAAEFSKFTELMTDFCKQSPEEWKYRTPEKTEQLGK